MVIDVYPIRQHAENVKSVAKRLRELATAPVDGVTEISRRLQSDDTLEGPERERRFQSESTQLLVQATATAAEAATPLYLSAEASAAAVATAADAARPRRDVSTAATVALSRERWEATLELLKSGRELLNLIRSADLDTVLAIEAFAPNWHRAQTVRPGFSTQNNEADEADAADFTVKIQARVTERIIEVAGPSIAEVLSLAKRTEGYMSIVNVWAKSLVDAVNTRSGHTLESSFVEASIISEYGLESLGNRVAGTGRFEVAVTERPRGADLAASIGARYITV